MGSETKTRTDEETVCLLRECNEGVKMGILSLEEVMPHVKSPELSGVITVALGQHETLREETGVMIRRYHDPDKEPGMMVKGMSWLRTNVQLAMKDGDATVADLLTDGCGMGIKSLSKYLNQFPGAEEEARHLARRIIGAEEELACRLRAYL